MDRAPLDCATPTLGHERTRVLVVEDDPDFASLVAATLESSPDSHFDVDHEDRLEGALERLRSGKYDALLLDLSLPDGYGLFTLNSTCASAPGTPVLVITSCEDSTLVDAAAQAGAREYLVKHRLNRRELPHTILRAIDTQRRQAPQAPELPQRGVAEEIAASIAQSAQSGTSSAVLSVGFDDFELLRDVLGPDFCKEMHRLAEIILGIGAEASARFTPVEQGRFVAVLANVRSEQAIARVCSEVLGSLSQLEFRDSSGLTVVEGITASVGVSMTPRDAGDPDTLLERAREAQLCAMRAGGSRYWFYRSTAEVH